MVDQLINAGDLAPSFKGRTFDNQWVDLASYRGKKVWLMFYRYEGCPICTRHTVELLNRQEELKSKGIELVAIYRSKPTRVPDLTCQNARAAFPCLADPEKRIYKLYGVGESWLAVVNSSARTAWLQARSQGFKQPRIDGGLFQKTAHFLIREDGVVVKASYGETIARHLSVDEVLEITSVPTSSVA